MANSTKISEYSTTAANNTSIDSIDIDENCAASGINNALRSVLKHQADAFTQGTPIALDQTNNRVGIGTTSPSHTLHVLSDGSSVVQKLQYDGSNVYLNFVNDTSSTGYIGYDNSNSMEFWTNNTEKVTITSGGKVGIGTNSPDQTLHVHNGSAGSVSSASSAVITVENDADAYIQFLTPNTNQQQIRFGDPQDNGIGILSYNHSDNSMRFATNGPEKMRIDSSGQVLVGKTSSSISNTGIELQPSGVLEVTRSGGVTMQLNRLSNDGDLIGLRKDGTLNGTISINGGRVFVSGPSRGLSFGHSGSNAQFVPVATNGNESDNNVDLGASNIRFDDIYATNGTIQTSDQNEKQQIASLTTAEMTAAKAISKLFKTFKWNSSVTESGDAARRHAGVIAQEVQTAMTDAGLDAADYAFWCSNTWWEISTDVPAVEADEEAGIEAQDAYTRIDRYYTADEAPEGANQRTRLGIRYPELLAFIGAATEQRLADIETRLTALEA